MPYSIEKDPASKSGRVIVRNKETNAVKARPASRERAVKMIQAIYANEEREGKKP